MSASIETVLDRFTFGTGWPSHPKTYYDYKTLALAAMVHAQMYKHIELFDLSAYFFVRINRLDMAFKMWKERNELFSERVSYTSP